MLTGGMPDGGRERAVIEFHDPVDDVAVDVLVEGLERDVATRPEILLDVEVERLAMYGLRYGLPPLP